MRKPTRRFAALASAVVLGIGALSACGARDSSTASGAASGGADSAGDDKSITIGIAAGWDEDVAVSHLWKRVLEDHGYQVTLTELDVAPVFVGVARGDLDLFFDTWLPVTHADYWEKYQDQVEDLGVWYDQATLNIAVPEYVADKKPIVVTLWHPHWAYSAFPIKDLSDPKGALGSAEKIHSISSKAFAESHPEVAEAIRNFEMDDATLADLEKVVLQDHADDLEAGVEAWVKDNQEYVDSLFQG